MLNEKQKLWLKKRILQELDLFNKGMLTESVAYKINSLEIETIILSKTNPEVKRVVFEYHQKMVSADYEQRRTGRMVKVEYEESN